MRFRGILHLEEIRGITWDEEGLPLDCKSASTGRFLV